MVAVNNSENSSFFVVQEHHATNLHWDFRIAYNGVLKSWAVPKGVPTESGVKRLAIMVDDHDLSWADFEGEIPEGQYGAGKVIQWDRGECIVKSYDPNSKIELELNGKKLQGDYILIRFKKGGEKAYLIFRK